MNTKQIVHRAFEIGTIIPAFNVTHLPMLKPIAKAIADEDSFALIEVARLDWVKLGAQSMEAVQSEYARYADERYMRLHLDHIPVIDEDGITVDYVNEIKKAITLGYGSVMVDASRLSLDENIACTKVVADIAGEKDLAVEAELGAVLGHEDGPMPPYEEIFASGRGFTKPEEAARLVNEGGCDWLSVAVGNVHGAISEAYRDQKKPDARLNIEHIARLKEACSIPLVLHGGSGIGKAYIMQAMKNGIAKINVGTEIRQPFTKEMAEHGDEEKARNVVYEKTRSLIRDFFETAGNRIKLGL